MVADGSEVPSGTFAIESRSVGTSTTSEKTLPQRKTRSCHIIDHRR
jgi:hypothetical protein